MRAKEVKVSEMTETNIVEAPELTEQAEHPQAAEVPAAPKKRGKKEKTDKEKLSLAHRAIRVLSILSLIGNVLAFLLVVLAGALSFQLSAADLAEILGAPENEVRIHLLIDLGLAALIIALGTAQAIVGLRLKKNPKLVRAFIVLSALVVAYNGVDFIFSLSMGSYAEVSDIVSNLVGIAVDVLMLVLGVLVAREVDPSPEEIAAKKAAKEYKKQHKLGFMFLLQLGFALNVIGTIIVMAVTSRNDMVYDTNAIFNWITIVLDALCFYLIWKRLAIARPALIVLSAINIVFNLIELWLADSFNLGSILFVATFDVIVIIYMCVAKRPKRLLVNELTFELRADIDGDYIATKGWPKWRNLIMYYCVFSVIGHWMELAFCLLIQAGIVQGETDLSNTMLWRDLLFPFPMEGIAVVICALWLYPLKQWFVAKIDKPFIPLLCSFIVNGLLCTCIEFIGGITFNAQHQHWDYSNMPFNFMGQVCLQNAIGFAFVCTLIVWVVYPAMERFIARVPGDVMNIVFVGVVTFNVTLQVLYLIEPASVAAAFAKLGNTIASIGG